MNVFHYLTLRKKLHFRIKSEKALQQPSAVLSTCWCLPPGKGVTILHLMPMTSAVHEEG